MKPQNLFSYMYITGYLLYREKRKETKMGKIFNIDGDLVKGREADVFCHQCNCFGRMGAGIAKQIAKTYPAVEQADKDNLRRKGAYGQFGTILPVDCGDGRICVNMYSQFGFGKGLQTDYEKFDSCLQKLVRYLKDYPEKTVGFPYMIGCGLAGGDWNVIGEKLRAFAEKIPNDVYIVRWKA